MQHRSIDQAPILVTGGTGTLGRLVVTRLVDAGRKVRVLTRSDRDGGQGIEFVTGDLAAGDGIPTAVDGIGTVVHCAGTQKGDDDKARHLVRAASEAGVGHLVYISVVGADRVPMDGVLDRMMFGYFGSKAAAEKVVAGSGVPWTTVRATQFHELTLKVAEGMARMPVIPVPKGIRFQPVAAADVADRLVDLAIGEAAGLVPDVAGPRVYGMDELVRSYLQATGKRRPLLPVGLPGRAARAMRDGANLSPDRAVGRQTWEEFLAERVTVDHEVNSPIPAARG